MKEGHAASATSALAAMTQTPSERRFMELTRVVGSADVGERRLRLRAALVERHVLGTQAEVLFLVVGDGGDDRRNRVPEDRGKVDPDHVIDQTAAAVLSVDRARDNGRGRP